MATKENLCTVQNHGLNFSRGIIDHFCAVFWCAEPLPIWPSGHKHYVSVARRESNPRLTEQSPVHVTKITAELNGNCAIEI